jgi:NADH-quinone oxidoreductase subunit E
MGTHMKEEFQLTQTMAVHRDKHGGLISILTDIQNSHGYLPAELLEDVADRTGIPLVDIYGVATFYKAFSLEPKGEHLCSVCVGTACHVRGAPTVAAEFEDQLGVAPGETTEDREFTLETVNCLGACALGPIVVTDGRYHSKVNRSRVETILDGARNGHEAIQMETDKRLFPVSVACPRCNHSLMDSSYEIDGHPSIRVTASSGGHHGWLRLTGLYGSHAVESAYEIPTNTVVHFFCPHCHAELLGAMACPECGLPMVSMIVRGGGVVQICAKRGCLGHVLDVG